jgi:hypothetical protein
MLAGLEGDFVVSFTVYGFSVLLDQVTLCVGVNVSQLDIRPAPVDGPPPPLGANGMMCAGNTAVEGMLAGLEGDFVVSNLKSKQVV